MTRDALAVNIRCGLSTAFRNKENITGKRSALGYSFNPVAIPTDELVRCILSGKAFTPGWFNGATRKNETFISSELIVLDYDHNVSIADLLGNRFIRAHAMLIYATPSSTSECYKTRAVIRLSEAIEAVEAYRTVARAVAQHVGLDVDPASWKPAQPYYGSTNQIEQPYTNLDAYLDITFAAGLTVDQATDDYLRETTRATYTPVEVNSDRAERYAAATVQGALDDYHRTPAGAKLRHDAYLKLAARLYGMKLGGWPTCGNIESAIRDAGHATDRTPREIEDVISWAVKNVEPIPLELPATPEDSAPVEPQPTPDVWFNRMPDTWRSAYLSYYTPSTVCIVELFTQGVAQGQIDPMCFTIGDMLAANTALSFDIPKTTLYRGIDELVGELFQKSDSKESPSGSLVSDSGNNSGRGRKSACYSLLPIPKIKRRILENANPRIYERAHPVDETPVLARPRKGMLQAVGVGEGEAESVAQELDTVFAPAYQAQNNKEQTAIEDARRKRERLEQQLDNYYSTTLPEAWPLGTSANYRAAFAHATIKPIADKPLSRKDFAERVGVDPSTVTKVRQRAGLKAIIRRSIVTVKSTQDVYTQSRKLNSAGERYVLHLVSNSAQGSKSIHRGEIESELKAGAEVIAKFNLSSTHEVVRETPPTPVERKPRLRSEKLQSRSSMSVGEPKSPPYFGTGYDPRWVFEQFKLALKLLGWQNSNGHLINPETGEYAPDQPLEIIELLIGRSLSESPPEDWSGLVADAVELGAVVDIDERAI